MEKKKLEKNGSLNRVRTATNNSKFGKATKEIGISKRSKDNGYLNVTNKRIISKKEISKHGGLVYVKKKLFKYTRGGMHARSVVKYRKKGTKGWRLPHHDDYNTYEAAWIAGQKELITEIFTDNFLRNKLSAVLADSQTYTLKTNISKYHGDGSDIVE